jgi:hypothetical protein
VVVFLGWKRVAYPIPPELFVTCGALGWFADAKSTSWRWPLTGITSIYRKGEASNSDILSARRLKEKGYYKWHSREQFIAK